MNICLFLISEGWGGAENVVYNISKYLIKKGYRVNIILNEEVSLYFKDLKKAKIYNIGPVFDYPSSLKNNFNIYLSNFFDRMNILKRIMRFVFDPLLRNMNYKKIRSNVIEIINEINPDVIHFHNPIVLEFYSHLNKSLKCPKVYTVHGKDFEKQISPFKWLFELRKRDLVKSFDKVSALSENGEQYLKRNGVNIPVTVIPNGIDHKNLKSLKVNMPSGLKSKEAFSLMFPGGLKPDKGGLILLKTVEILNSKKMPIKVFYAGVIDKEFEEKNRTENVHFTGLLPHNEYLNKLNNCDCLILLSKTEEFSIAILEAMGLGKSIITTSVGGTPDFFINQRNGLFVERNPIDAAEKISFLYERPELRRKIFENNIHDVKKFDWDSIVEKYISLYRSI